MKKYFYILLLFFIFNYKYSYCDFITFPFKKIIPSDINETNFYSKVQHNIIYTTVKVGTPNIEIKAQIKNSQYSICIRNDSIYNNIASSTYKSDGKIISIYNRDYTTAISSNDTFIFGQEQREIDEINFMYTQKTNYDLDGILGLRIKENNYLVNGHGLINQLKTRKIIGKEVFFFNFDENGDNGNLYIGEYPHFINKFEEEFPEYNYKWASINIPSYDINFELKFIKVFWKNKEMEIDSRAYINIESGYIIGSKYFEDISYEFFSSFFINRTCKRKEVNVLYNAYICDETPELDISKFPDINFYSSDADHNFVLTYRDMFVKKDGKVYFMVIFDKKGYNVDWTLGYTFIKRNKIVFDIDKRVIGFYKGDKKKENIYIAYIVIISIAGAIILGLIGFIIYKFVWKKRSRKAYELDEDFEYTSGINA